MALEFQIYDWLEDHEIDEESSSSESEESSEEARSRSFIIHTFGRTLDGKSVYMKIVNFTPYFYIRLPEKWDKKEAKANCKKMFSYFTSSMNKKVWAKFRSCLTSMDIVEKMSPEGFTNGKKFLFARLIFNNSYAMKKFRFMFEASKIFIPGLTKKPMTFKTYEANLQPMLRCFHTKKISGCSWVSVEKYIMIEEDDKESYCDIELRVDWRKITPITKDQNAPFRILSFDIECQSSDGSFPQARRGGDKIIQIGSTYTYLGESLPYRQHIVCLDETANVEGAIVEWYDNERDMMLAWIKEVIKNDCDILTGYNIFYFDEPYIHDRCKEHLNLLQNITRMSKLKCYECNYRDFKLASSALGENRIRMFDTPGRVHIDLMKDVQKTYKLNSYKLDSVSSNFIRDKITKIEPIDKNKFNLYCKGIDDIFINDFIHIELVLDFISDEIGHKYEIVKIDKANKVLTITSKNSSELRDFLQNPREGTLWWSQAKDDVGPKDIFRLFRGSPEDRAIVAKYCVKDCRLVNLLVNKLEVVTKNIEMSNVCYVPLSFLFTRGQGIKLFSFCMKVYREEGYIFPVVKKPDEKTPSYEGAIVFDPEPTVEYEAYAVKDYASLYPSSIIHKNMSHETIVREDKYDNLPGVKYFNANFREYDGSIQYRRFAKVEGQFGVVPKILSTLLGERRAVKKQMKKEENPFKKKILDAKQLALKVTANSLYGSLGADTSQVCERDIAACTTSTGREMLIFAKKYDEEIVPGLINGLKHAYKNKNEDVVNQLLEWELKGFCSKTKEEKSSIIKKIKDYVTKDINKLTLQPIIKYGDSVIGDTPLLLMKDNKIFIDKIKNLSCLSESYNIEDKLYNKLDNIYTWTDNGWTKIINVMKHKLELHKKLYRVTTHSGSVIVTDDHSLLDNKGKKVTVTQLKVGDNLLHSFPTINSTDTFKVFNKNINNDISRLLGFFMGDGSCGYYENCKKASWCLNNKNLELLKYYKKILDVNFNNYDWIILNTLKSSNVYKLVIKKKTNDKVIDFIKVFRNLMYTSDKEKQIPSDILNSNYNIRYNFWIGLYDADGYKTNYGTLSKQWSKDGLFNNSYTDSKIKCGQTIVQKGYVSALSIYTLAKSLGYKVSINTRKDKLDIYTIRVSNKLRKEEDVIKKIELWTKNEDYVYDLTTDNHHFQAGVGSIIVHNTDSIFSCYRFREKTKQITDKDSLKLWKNIIKFSEGLIMDFIPFEYRSLWEELHQEYYRDELVTDLRLPNSPKVLPIPEHYKTILPIDERLKQFLKEYMEESYLPWLWTLQDIYNKTYTKDSIFKDMLNVKLFRMGVSLVENYRMVAEDMDEEIKATLSNKIRKFVEKTLKEYWIQPYWDVEDGMKVTRVKMYKGGERITDKRSLTLSIDMGIITGELIKSRLPFPHDLEYEKTFWPFLILTKKRYVGNKYEFDPNDYKQDYNGIVLKRRDNAPIVKEVCGGIINCLLNEKDPNKAEAYTRDCLAKMFNNEYNIKYFLTSKTLKMKESYADWTRIAHVVLADRISIREPGNCPQSGDRIAFAAVQIPNVTKDTLQGERIETPEYIMKNKLKLDYEFYMTNQIMKPSLQFLELALHKPKEIFEEFKVKLENDREGRTSLLDCDMIKKVS